MKLIKHLTTSFEYKDFRVTAEQDDRGNFNVFVSLIDSGHEPDRIAYCDTLINSLLAGEQWIDQGLFTMYRGCYLRVVYIECDWFGELIDHTGEIYVCSDPESPDACWAKLYEVAEKWHEDY